MAVNITDTLHVTTTEGVLATADEIYDKGQGKFQSQINSEKLNVVIISYARTSHKYGRDTLNAESQ